MTTPPLPQLSYDPNRSLPLSHLRYLATNYRQLLNRIQDLQATIHGSGQQIAPTWPEVLEKYSSILQQTAILSESLTKTELPPGSTFTAGILATQTQTSEWPRPPMNDLPHLLLHPTLPVPEPVFGLFGTKRPTPVLAADEVAVARFANERAAARREKVDDKVIISEMQSLRDEHDQRAEHALRAVRMLRSKHQWRARPDFARADADAADRARNAVSESSRPVTDVSNDEAEENETEQQIVVEPTAVADAPVDPLGQVSAAVPDSDDDKPLDSDDDLFEEVV